MLLVNAADRVLLLRAFDPAAPADKFWMTVGGGADPGESLAQAAARELHEEAGLQVEPAALGDPVWHRVAEFGFDGLRYRQEEDIFLLRVHSHQVSLAGLEEIEKQTVDGYRWWAAEELESTGENFFPAELPRLLRELT